MARAIRLTAALALTAALLPAPPARARVDLVTLPAREQVELTIYEAADLTLVRDAREVPLRHGENRLQFSWANTLIDPTSLELLPRAAARQVSVQDLVYPPRVRGVGIWNVEASAPGPVPVEISYFTSGIRWNAYYLATLDPAGERMDLEGYVRVSNRSGEDYDNARTRLVVGRVHLLDRIAELARRRYPYGRPTPPEPLVQADRGAPPEAAAMREAKAALGRMAPKEIYKEGVSEYFLYTIEGTENIPDGWDKRLLSFAARDVPVTNLYRYEEERYGPRPVRFLEFANDAAHNLGAEPIPGGTVRIFRRLEGTGRLAYVGGRPTRYVPVGGPVSLDLGPSDDVTVEVTPVRVATDGYEWRKGPRGLDEIAGWDEISTVRVRAANHRSIPVTVEIRRNVAGPSWEIRHEGEAPGFEKVDADTVQYTLRLPPGGRAEFTYALTLHRGSREL
ncbi:MAG: hypothetical protein Kow0092_04370 [Deferrisomatales bacterium]